MRSIRKTIAAVQGRWALKHLHLAPEPPGPRGGLVPAPGRPRTVPRGELREHVLTMTVVGDSMVAGCGTPEQSFGLAPALAARLADVTDRPVTWHAVGRLGATMRRVRYRQLPSIDEHSDLLILCAGSNDLMAARTPADWEADLRGAIELARDLADRVVVTNSGQLHRCPALPRILRGQLGPLLDRQTRASIRICQDYDRVQLIDTTAAGFMLEPGAWASDGFHPSASAYRSIADFVVGALDMPRTVPGEDPHSDH